MYLFILRKTLTAVKLLARWSLRIRFVVVETSLRAILPIYIGLIDTWKFTKITLRVGSLFFYFSDFKDRCICRLILTIHSNCDHCENV